MKVTGLPFKEGTEMKVWVKPSACCSRFSINIGHGPENLALHFNPRFDLDGVKNTIILNSLSRGRFGDEQRDRCFPFARGEVAECSITFNKEQFYIKLPNGSMLNFPNRMPDVKYDYFDIRDEAEFIGIEIK